LSVQVMDGYISKEEAKIIIEQFSPRLVTRRFAGAEAEFSTDIMDILKNIYDNKPITSDPELKEASALMTKFVNMVKEEINNFYGVDVVSANANFAEISEGGSNGLHCDSVQLDGTPWEDGNSLIEDLEFSALLYLNDSGEDYDGGELVFPNQEVAVVPKAGTLVF
jgi:predicted 2-oxoglutarate/Fe(II)-dependent dioxygenase YbiX